MFFCLPMAYLLFYNGVTCYVISPLLFVMLSTYTSDVCCVSLHCVGFVLDSDLSHLSLTWTLISILQEGQNSLRLCCFTASHLLGFMFMLAMHVINGKLFCCH